MSRINENDKSRTGYKIAKAANYLIAYTGFFCGTHSIFHPEDKENRRTLALYSVQLISNSVRYLRTETHLSVLSMISAAYMLLAEAVSLFGDHRRSSKG